MNMYANHEGQNRIVEKGLVLFQVMVDPHCVVDNTIRDTVDKYIEERRAKAQTMEAKETVRKQQPRPTANNNSNDIGTNQLIFGLAALAAGVYGFNKVMDYDGKIDFDFGPKGVHVSKEATTPFEFLMEGADLFW
jgi:hypothetical protein